MPKTNWKTYLEQNPRPNIPKDMKPFLDYAKEQYKNVQSESVNGTCCDNLEELENEIEDYLGNSMEMLLLFREYLLKNKKD